MAFTGGNQRQLIQITLFNLALLSVICFLAYSMKMEGWHFIPLMQIVALGNMLFLRRELLSNILKSQVFIITLLFFSVIFLFHLIKENRSNHDSINEKITLQSQIENLYKDKYLFYDVGTRELLDNYVFRLFKKRDNIYFYDLAQLVYLNEFAQQLNRLCQCNSFMPVEFLNFLKNNDRVKYISTPHRVEIIERYMSVIHDFKVHFVQRQEVQLNNVKHAQAIKKLGVYQVQ
jgi:hypothetical protein